HNHALRRPSLDVQGRRVRFRTGVDTPMTGKAYPRAEIMGDGRIVEANLKNLPFAQRIEFAVQQDRQAVRECQQSCIADFGNGDHLAFAKYPSDSTASNRGL